MYLCGRGIDFASIYDCSFEFQNSMVFVVFVFVFKYVINYVCLQFNYPVI